MSHEMTETDSAVYYKKAAWHGIGTVAEEAMSPKQALQMSGLDWNVTKSSHIDCHYMDDAGFSYTATSTAKSATIREDTGEILGFVSQTYCPVQNSELAELAYALGETTTVESFGSIRGGRRVYCLVHADSFTADNGQDDVHQYLLLANGHDGTLAMSGIPTSIRVVCENTLNMVLAQNNNMFRFTHNGDMNQKLTDARNALAFFRRTGKVFQSAVTQLTNKDWTHDDITRYWLDVYAKLDAPVVSNPQTEQEEKTLIRSRSVMATWADTFDRERRDLGSRPSPWLAANAVTNWLQHKEAKRGRKMTSESRIEKNLFGKNSMDSVKVVNMALQRV